MNPVQVNQVFLTALYGTFVILVISKILSLSFEMSGLRKQS